MLDAACSAYVEAPSSRWTNRSKLRPPYTDSPVTGASARYGDCPLTAQHSIVAALNATRLIGLPSRRPSLLMPTKSVTAVIGLFDGKVRDAQSRPTCNICRMREHCRFRAAHTTCYSSH